MSFGNITNYFTTTVSLIILKFGRVYNDEGTNFSTFTSVLISLTIGLIWKQIYYSPTYCRFVNLASTGKILKKVGTIIWFIYLCIIISKCE